MEGVTPGQTELDWDEIDGLIPDLDTRQELDEFELENIGEAERWVYSQNWTTERLLTISALTRLHKRMFGRVWAWAGHFRRTEKNIGVPPSRIAIQLRQVVDDVFYWVEHQTYSWAEILARFHHGLVFVHPFPNGNGRHARLATEALCLALDVSLPAWTDVSLTIDGAGGDRYISALQNADNGDFAPLLEYMYPGFGDE